MANYRLPSWRSWFPIPPQQYFPRPQKNIVGFRHPDIEYTDDEEEDYAPEYEGPTGCPEEVQCEAGAEETPSPAECCPEEDGEGW